MIETRKILLFKDEDWEEKGYKIPIYKYIPIDYLLQNIEKSELYIPSIQAWEDPYENFLANSEIFMGKTRVNYKEWLPHFYGSCWTLKKESDALWRIYSPDRESVRIKTSVVKLAQACSNEKGYEPNSTRVIKIGPVMYMNQKEIQEWIQKEINHNKILNDISLINSLFIKRKEFSHEQEVRVVIHKNAPSEGRLSLSNISILIEPKFFFDEIIFDPRIKSTKLNLYKRVLEQLGYQGKVKKSQLYDFIPFRINM